MDKENRNDPKKESSLPDGFISELEGSLDNLFAETDNKTNAEKKALKTLSPAAKKKSKKATERPEKIEKSFPSTPAKEKAPDLKKETKQKPSVEKDLSKIPQTREKPLAAVKEPTDTLQYKTRERTKEPAKRNVDDQIVSQDEDRERKLPIKVIIAVALILIVVAIVYIFYTPSGFFTRSGSPNVPTAHKIKAQPEKKAAAIKRPATPETLEQRPVRVEKPALVTVQKHPPKKIILPVEKKPTVQKDINTFLNSWKIAWEKSAGKNGDIKTYMSFYSDRFVSGKLDKAGWEKDKAIKNSRKEWIRIDLKNITISGLVANNTFKINFIQDYRSSNYSAVSEKTLIILKEPSGWKILTKK
ncbi:hypothetical protein ACFL0M_06695 [Thermodesulfobacteriota bacterium]